MHFTSVLAAMKMFIHLMIGVSALSMNRRANTSLDFVFEAAPAGSCEHYKPEAEACDIADKKRGDLSAQKRVRPIFVKFHKVGGTTLMELINAFSGVTTNCGRTCGECFCTSQATACTGHVSRVVLQHYVRAAQKAKHPFLKASASIDTPLLLEKERRDLFAKVDPWSKQHTQRVPMTWLTQRSGPSAAVLFITLLRDPVERIRSKYYFTQHLKSVQISKHMSFMEWMEASRSDHETCCEYVAAFGIGSLETSKLVLASLFDVIGFTEDMDEIYFELADQFGVPRANLPPQISCRDDSTHKEPWTSEQLNFAKQIAAEDIELYEFARDLKKKRQGNELQQIRSEEESVPQLERQEWDSAPQLHEHEIKTDPQQQRPEQATETQWKGPEQATEPQQKRPEQATEPQQKRPEQASEPQQKRPEQASDLSKEEEEYFADELRNELEDLMRERLSGPQPKEHEIESEPQQKEHQMESDPRLKAQGIESHPQQKRPEQATEQQERPEQASEPQQKRPEQATEPQQKRPEQASEPQQKRLEQAGEPQQKTQEVGSKPQWEAQGTEGELRKEEEEILVDELRKELGALMRAKRPRNSVSYAKRQKAHGVRAR